MSQVVRARLFVAAFGSDLKFGSLTVRAPRSRCQVCRPAPSTPPVKCFGIFGDLCDL